MGAKGVGVVAVGGVTGLAAPPVRTSREGMFAAYFAMKRPPAYLDGFLHEAQVPRAQRQRQLQQTPRALRDENRGGEAALHQRVDRLLYTPSPRVPCSGRCGTAHRSEAAPARCLRVIPAERAYRSFPWRAFPSSARQWRWS